MKKRFHCYDGTYAGWKQSAQPEASWKPAANNRQHENDGELGQENYANASGRHPLYFRGHCYGDAADQKWHSK